MDEHQRQRVRLGGAGVEGVDPLAVDDGRDLRDLVEPRLGGAPVELRRTTTAAEPSSLAVYATAAEVRARLEERIGDGRTVLEETVARLLMRARQRA